MSSDSQKIQDFIRQRLNELDTQIDLDPDVPEIENNSMEEQFNYVAAREWEPEYSTDDLCIYTYGHQIQKGTLADALEFLAYVQSRDSEGKEYHIYKVSYEKLT